MSTMLRAAVLTLALATARPVAAQDGTAGVFRRYADQVVKVQIVESGSGARAVIGSGFFIDGDGRVVTNYHVISRVVHDPERYRAELVGTSEGTTPLTVLGVDVVHDLALLASEVRSDRWLELGTAVPAQGERLYALGHPNDLGLSIVEGTYNGNLQHTLYPKIHFTGSINPGMSGGPTIDDAGRVIGINVSTSGEQVSFLVPVDRAARLVTSVANGGAVRQDSLLHEVGRQITAYQTLYLDGMFGDGSPVVDLGGFSVPTQPASFFRCWADATRSRELAYESVSHRCSTDDYLYVAGDQRSGVVRVTHELLTTTQLNAVRFYSLYSDVFGRDNTPAGTEEHVTKWSCATRTVRGASAPLRTVLCVRRYRKLDGLYDAVLKVAVLGRRDAGLVTTLSLSGVTAASIDTLSARYLERITWH